jgi:putative ABC transport system permease protein
MALAFVEQARRSVNGVMSMITVKRLVPVAWRNLRHDRVRFAVTLTGIVFSVLLSAIQLGLFVGFTRATSEVISHSGADIWIRSRGVTHLETAAPFLERRRHQVLEVPGVVSADPHIVRFGNWTKPDGAIEGILVVGIDLESGLGRPWNLVRGRVADLDEDDAVIVDELYAAKLGIAEIGDTAEINGVRARIVGFTRGIRSFTTAPPVFTRHAQAQRYLGLATEQTLYLLVRAAPGVDPAALARRIEATVPGITAQTTDGWCAAQQYYWMFGTGAGVTVLIAAGLGLLVGVVVVAQTIYAATVDHIREFGTLKAMGATNGYIYRVIIEQAVISAVGGYAIGMALAQAASALSQRGTTAILLPWPLTAALFGITVGMCVLASIVSINKVTRLDPAIVFKG